MPGQPAPSSERDQEDEGRRDQRPGAGGEHGAGKQDPARGGGDEQPVGPAALDVAGQVDPGRGAGEARPLQHADRHDEALVGPGGEAVELGQGAEDAVEAEEEDRRRQHARDRGPRHPQQLVLGARHQRRDRRQVGAPLRQGRGRLHQPTLSRWRRARALSTSPSMTIAGDRQHRLEQFGGIDPGDDRSADAFDDEAERVVFGDRPGRLDHQIVGEEGGGEEEDDEDQREEALDDAGAAGAQRDRGADPADRHRRGGDEGDRDQGAGDAAVDFRAEDQPDREEPERGEEAQRRRPGQPPEHDRVAGDRGREEAVGEAHLDVDRERDAAAVAGQHQRLHHRPGQHELEEALHRREAGQVDRAAGAAGLDRQQQGGEDDDRRHQLRPAEGLADRAHAQRPDDPDVGRELLHASTASGSASPSSSFSRWWPVLATKTSSRVGRTSSSDSTPIPASSSARTTRRDVGGAVLDLDQDRLAVLRRQQLADPGADFLRFGDRALRQLQLDVGMADLGLQRLRRALGDDPAAVDDADVVGELVGLLQVLGGEEDGGALVVERPHLLPDRLAADRVEAGGRLVEEEHPRLVDQRRGEVEAALHPARVGADAAVGGRDEVDPLEQVVGAALALAPGRPCSVACRRISSRPVISGSSAASCSATPIEARTARASRITS